MNYSGILNTEKISRIYRQKVCSVEPPFLMGEGFIFTKFCRKKWGPAKNCIKNNRRRKRLKIHAGFEPASKNCSAWKTDVLSTLPGLSSQQ